MAKTRTTKVDETLKDDEATRRNIPPAEYQSVMQKGEQSAAASRTSAAQLVEIRERVEEHVVPKYIEVAKSAPRSPIYLICRRLAPRLRASGLARDTCAERP